MPWILAVALLLGVQPAGAAAVARLPTEQCLRAVFAEGASPRLSDPVSLEELCPDIPGQLSQAPWRAMLRSPPEAGRATVVQVMDLHQLVQDIQAPPRGPRLDAAPVAQIVADTLQRHEQERGWWQRFLDWLERFRGKEPEDDMGWLVDWLGQVPDWAWSALWRTTVALILVLAVAVIANELHVAGPGLWRWGRRRRAAAAPVPAAARAEPPLDLAAVRNLPLQQQPVAMFALAVATLTRRGLLPADHSRTARELQAVLPPRPPALAAHFADLRLAAERSIYGDQMPQQGHVSALYAELEPLLAATPAQSTEP